ncbi:MAG TPA: Ig-like domain-containing protein [Opitutaceae bacterium]
MIPLELLPPELRNAVARLPWAARRAVALGVAGASFALPSAAAAAIYYVDAAGGSDSNAGTTPDAPWRTVAPVNKSRFQPGDQILFNGGQTHVGNLAFANNDSGTAAAPVIVSSYGTGRATLYSARGDGIKLSGTSYLTLANLNIAGPGWNAANDGSRGVVLAGSAHHCLVDNLIVTGFHKAGVRTETNTHDNAITFVTAEQNGYVGIHVSGRYQFVSDCKALSNQGDVTVTNNWSGSGILVSDASYVTVEYSESAHNGAAQPWTGNGPVGIWCWDADHVTFRHCISHHNKRGRGNADGGGFDFDGGTTDSLIEHCYSYNNAGPGYMVYNFNWQEIPNRNNVIRYSISENDAQGGVYLGTSGLPLENIEIHNVVAFNTNGGRVLYNGSGTKTNVNLRNNIFLTSGTLTINGNQINLQGNCYYSTTGTYSFGAHGSDFAAWAQATGDELYNGALIGLNTNPLLLEIGSGTKLTDPRQLSTLRSYSAASAYAPVIDAGLDLRLLLALDPGSTDLIGAAIPRGAFDMGAYEFQGTASTDTVPPTVSLTAPLDGAIVSGWLTLSADAADEVGGSGIAGVQFQLDGLNLGSEDTASPYSLTYDSALIANGTHVLTAIARDAAGNTTTSESVIAAVENSAPPPGLGPITQDNADASGVTITGTWTPSTSVAGYYGTNYLAATAGSNSVCFTPTFPQTGNYDVYVRWTAHTNRATNAPIDVNHAGGTATFSVDMRTSGSTWVLLGTFTFGGGTAGNITVRTTSANGYVVADAVQFIPR